jgi:uncharacterized membrane protein
MKLINKNKNRKKIKDSTQLVIVNIIVAIIAFVDGIIPQENQIINVMCILFGIIMVFCAVVIGMRMKNKKKL